MLFEHGFYLKTTILGPDLHARRYAESVAPVTDHFADAFVRENVSRVYMMLWQRYDVRKFDADAILF